VSFGLVSETPYDLRFRLFGVPVRVHPFFWIMAALISWDFLHFGLHVLLMCIACIFVSILLHEFGHVWMGQYFRTRGHIVLFAFGGLAYDSNLLHNPWKRIAVSAAGPGIQLLFWALLRFVILPLIPLPTSQLGSDLYRVLEFLILVNLYWPLLNLLPIWPLDGGQITRDFLRIAWPRDGVRLSLHLSIGVCLLLAIHAVYADRTGESLWWVLPTGINMAIFFGVFMLIGFQALQEENARRPFLDDSTPWDEYR
jgi:Zn-dependent protease